MINNRVYYTGYEQEDEEPSDSGSDRHLNLNLLYY